MGSSTPSTFLPKAVLPSALWVHEGWSCLRLPHLLACRSAFHQPLGCPHSAPLLLVLSWPSFLFQPPGPSPVSESSQCTHRRAFPPRLTCIPPPTAPHTHPHAGRLKAMVQESTGGGEQRLRLRRVKKGLNTHQMEGVSFLCLPLPALLGSNAIFLPSLNFSHIIR